MTQCLENLFTTSERVCLRNTSPLEHRNTKCEIEARSTVRPTFLLDAVLVLILTRHGENVTVSHIDVYDLRIRRCGGNLFPSTECLPCILMYVTNFLGGGELLGRVHDTMPFLLKVHQMKHTLQSLVGLIVYYIVAVSIFEYVIHKYVTHSEHDFLPGSKLHKVHHNHRDPPDGKMKVENCNQCNLLITKGQANLLFLTGSLSMGIPARIFLRANYSQIVAASLASMYYVLITWNTLHADSHGELYRTYTGCDTYVRPSVIWASIHPFRRFINANHIRHHTTQGTLRFNTTVPLIGDALFGTL